MTLPNAKLLRAANVSQSRPAGYSVIDVQCFPYARIHIYAVDHATDSLLCG